MKRRVLLESPYAGDIEANVAYARRALRHAIVLGEAPIAGHLLYTQVLDDAVPEERTLGISCHTEWIGAVDALVIYTDRGISKGMQHAIDLARKQGVPVEERSIANWQLAGGSST